MWTWSSYRAPGDLKDRPRLVNIDTGVVLTVKNPGGGFVLTGDYGNTHTVIGVFPDEETAHERLRALAEHCDAIDVQTMRPVRAGDMPSVGLNPSEREPMIFEGSSSGFEEAA